MKTSNAITIVGKNEENFLLVAGSKYRILISDEETNGSYAVIEMLVPPGSGPIPHAHKDVQETFYVAEGEMEFRTEGGKSYAKKGAFINIPLGGAIHAFKNTSDTEVTLICTVIPAGFDSMFKEISIAGPEEVEAIGEKYGNQFYPPDYFD
ncbi:Cupin domain-containing protein [Chitinophaga sp. CF118]|uniref:cupin domain-containing protein n=1 Tax=Chitinophaga sp. CF118 TaxID=1884367 RepID=UPI0008DF2567|nr:cupin domain-containing protein [Chitinophaga sp. CF118]SFD86719.1 Cupin domain-containing protein [Chitinophaga sp. CF118]